MRSRTKRPVIGVTKPEDKRMNLSFIILWLSLWLSGGRPKIISYKKEVEEQHIDGLMLGGGSDIFPGLYFKDPQNDYPYDKNRDSLEIKLLKRANKSGMPVFAICRGAQLMNVVNGGTLHADIRKVYEGANYPENVIGYLFFRKWITVYKDTLLYRIFEKKEIMVNSIHRQSIDKVGENLIVSSRETNGIIQSIERPNHPFYMGVQFHPERLFYRKVFRTIFNKFILTVSQYHDEYNKIN